MKRALPYNKDDIELIKQNFRTWSNTELGVKLNRSAASIRKKRFNLGFDRTPAELKRIRQRNPNLFKSGDSNNGIKLITNDKGYMYVVGW